MDNLCSGHIKGIMQYIHTIEHLPNHMREEGREIIKKNLGEWINTHNKIKTICAKLDKRLMEKWLKK